MSNRGAIFWLLMVTLAALAANVLHTRFSPETCERGWSARSETVIDPVRIVLKGPSGAQIVLEKTEGWRLAEPYGGRADSEAVMRLVDTLLETSPSDVIGDSELLRLGRSRAALDLDYPRLTVELEDAERHSLQFDFGAVTPSSNEVYVAIGGKSSVMTIPYKVYELASRGADSFRERRLLLCDPAIVVAMDIRRQAGPILALTRDGDTWQAGASAASKSAIGDFLTQISASRALDFAWPTGATNESEIASASLLSGYGLDPENAVVVAMRCADGSQQRLSLGNVFAGAGGRRLAYALVQNGSAVVTVPAELKDAVLQDTRRFVDSRMFPVEAADVVSFAIADGDVGYVIARGANGVWRLDAPVAAPADGEIVDALLKRVLALDEADAEGAGIGVSVGTNTTPRKVSAERLLQGLRLEDLRSKEVIRVDAADVRRIVSSVGSAVSTAAVSVVRAADRTTWNLETESSGVTASAAGIEKVLKAINPLQAEKVVTLRASEADLAQYGLETPFATIAIDREQKGTVRRNILIGAQAQGGRYATVGSAEAVFVISEATAASLTSALEVRGSENQ